MAGIRDIKRQISSVHNTQKITKAMKMVSAAKMRRANEAMSATKPYADKIREVTLNLFAHLGSVQHSYLTVPEEVNRIALLVINSDRGLCGSFNSNITRMVTAFCANHLGKEIQLYVVGKNAYDYFKRRDLEIKNAWTSCGGKITYSLAEDISEALSTAFIDRKIDNIYMIYNEFHSVSAQVVKCEQLLPLSLAHDAEQTPVDYIFEPDPEVLLADLLPKYVTFSIYHSLLESSAGEHGARMVAMDNATRSADDMIRKLTLHYNKARQAAITTDLLDIVNGAEALK